MFRAIILLLALALPKGTLSDRQVRLTVSPGEHRPHQYITGVIRNSGTQSITVCLELEESHRLDRQAQPFSFSVQRLEQNEWTTVLARPGTASAYTQVITPGMNLAFPFTLQKAGQYRLLLRYWLGDAPQANCQDLAAGDQVASRTFQVSD